MKRDKLNNMLGEGKGKERDDNRSWERENLRTL